MTSLRYLVVSALVLAPNHLGAIQNRPATARQATVAKPAPLAIEKAEADGLITVSAEGTGGSSGDVIVLVVRRVVNRPLRLALNPGMTLRSAAANVQNMIVYALKGEATARGYRPSAFIELSDDKERRYVVEAYCLDFDKENPDSSHRLTLGPPDDRTLAILRAIPKDNWSIKIAQAAIWLGQGVTAETIKTRFDASDLDLFFARMAIDSLQRRR